MVEGVAGSVLFAVAEIQVGVRVRVACKKGTPSLSLSAAGNPRIIN